jgi:hypothetical protein
MQYPPLPSQVSVLQLPLPLPLLGQYCDDTQQLAFDVHGAPPQEPPPSGPIPPSGPQPMVHPSEHMAPLFAHSPLLWQSCGCDPKHCIAPGVHTPLQALPTQAWFGQTPGAPHSPLAVQVWIASSPEHSVAPGLHTPVQPPLTHA